MFASCRIREQSIVPDPHQPGRQDVQQEAAKKFLYFDSHLSVRITACSVLPPKRHAFIIKSY